jgi:hypothetical protein
MATTEKFLKPNEVTVCKRLAISDSNDNKRATALLAIHTGETQVNAAAISGLTAGQVRYIVRRFRVMGLNALSYDEAETVKTVAVDVEAEPEAKVDKPNKAKKKDKDKKKTKKTNQKDKDKKKGKNKKSKKDKK